MALQPINIKVTDDVENYITAEMDAKIYSQLVSEGIAKDVGNACKVVIGENDIKIQNGLFNIGGYFASIKDFHSISKPVQNNFYVKAKFVKGVSQDEFTIYTDTDSNLVQQDLFNGGTIRELLIAEVHNKNEVTMKSVNLSLAEIRNALQNILDAENQRVKAEKERIEKEIERQKKIAEFDKLVKSFDGTKISQRLDDLKTDLRNDLDNLKENLSDSIQSKMGDLETIFYKDLGIQETELLALIGELCSDGTKPLDRPLGDDPTYYSLRKVDGKLCIINGTINELKEFTKTQQGG